MEKFKGIIPAVFTPFKPNEEIDEESFSNLIRFLIDSTSESSYAQIGKILLKWQGVIKHETVIKPLSHWKTGR